MGLFDFLTGSSSDSSTTTNVVNDKNTKLTQLENTTGGKSQQVGTVGSQTQNATSLGQTQQDQLTSFLTELIGRAQTPDTSARDLALVQRDRALAAPGAVAGDIASIVEAARTKGELALAKQNTSNAANAGSSLNSVVQALGLENSNALETKLAGVAGQLDLQGRQVINSEFSSASDALRRALDSLSATSTTQASGVANIADTLKGSSISTTTNSEQQQTTNEVTQLVKALQQLSEGKTVQTTNASGTSSNSGSVLDIFNTLSRFPG